MSVLSLSDQLRRELLRRRLPRFYVHRAVREYVDHFRDISREGVGEESSAARLGDPEALAAQLATEYRARHFAGRHPWLVCALAPIPSTMLAVGLFFATGMFLMELVEPLLGPVGLRSVLIVNCYASFLVPILGMTWLFGRWAIRSGSGARWFWTASILQCLLGAMAQFQFTYATENTSGYFVVGLSLPPEINWPFLALPLLTAIGLAWHVSRRSAPELAEV